MALPRKLSSSPWRPDVVAGLIHWAEDAYFTEDTPILGEAVIKRNIVRLPQRVLGEWAC